MPKKRQITLDEQRLRAFCEGLEMGDIEQALQQPPEFWFAYGQTKHELEKDHAAKARAWEVEHKTMKAPAEK